MRARSAAAIAMAVMAIAPAGAMAKRGSIFDVTLAKGFERITFTGDENGSCINYGVCGYSGTTTYSISGKPKGTIVLVHGRGGRISGGASYSSHGVTRTTVTPPPDSGGMCTDTVRHKTDLFSLRTSGTTFQSLLLTYHGRGDDYLDTGCPGPNEASLVAGGGLPAGAFSRADFFRGPSPSFRISGGFAFKGGGFSANSDWKLRFKAVARGCNPRCRLPAHRPR